MKTKIAASLFCARLLSAAQNCILPYRRFAICAAGELQKRLDISGALPNAIRSRRRGSRLKICATFCGLGLFVTSCSTTSTPPTPVNGAPAGGVTLSDFKLTGDLGGEVAAFTLTANARVEDAKGGSLELLSGPVALTSTRSTQKWADEPLTKIAFVATFDRGGIFPVEVHFNAAVTQSNDWSAVIFSVAPSAVQPVVLQGLAADTEFQFANAARPERSGTNFVSYLPVDGAVQFAWKKSRGRRPRENCFTPRR